MEELLKKAEKLKIVVTEGITEDELAKIIAEKEKDNKKQEIEAEKEKKNKKNKKDEIRVIDNNNKPISKNIEAEKVKTLGIDNKKTIHNKKLKQAKNREYYEELADGIGMWSRTGESFLLKDLDK